MFGTSLIGLLFCISKPHCSSSYRSFQPLTTQFRYSVSYPITHQTDEVFFYLSLQVTQTSSVPSLSQSAPLCSSLLLYDHSISQVNGPRKWPNTVCNKHQTLLMNIYIDDTRKILVPTEHSWLQPTICYHHGGDVRLSNFTSTLGVMGS